MSSKVPSTMTLNHSKTWPVSTMAVVQLRVDPHGRAYSTLRQEPPPVPPDAAAAAGDLTRELLMEKTNGKKVGTIGTIGESMGSMTMETVSTIVEEDGECPIHSHKYHSPYQDRNAELRYCIERFHVLALGRIDEESAEYGSGSRSPYRGPGLSISNGSGVRYMDASPGSAPGGSVENSAEHADVNVLPRDGLNLGKEKDIDIGSGGCDKKCFSELHLDARKTATLYRHYYPEGGWGWLVIICSVLVHILNHGLQLSCSVLANPAYKKFHAHSINTAGWLGALSTGVALLVSPVTIAFCRRKSTRVTAVMGGLVTALGCLFTSFASQFHQLFFSYGTVVGVGVGITRDCSTLMVAQYFKRRREFVEIFIVSGSGLGIAVMSAFIKGAISAIGWRLGLQAVTGVVFLTFILGTFYRSASLYHPQRRAILHLKNQKRKIKDKNKVDDRPPFFDFSTLKSKTVRILLVSTGISAFGINTPIFYLAHQAEEEGLGDTAVLLQAYLGLAWTLGCAAFGLLVVHNSVECRIARQYLCQAAVFMCGLSILALTAVHGNYHGYVMFAWIYGIFCGGYHYSLKMYTYERVRARNFARTWGFVQCSQAIPIAIGVPISGYMNVGCGGKAGYYFSSTCVLVGSLTLFFIDLHRRQLSRHKHTRANGTRHLCVSESCPQRRRLSFTQEPDNDGGGAAAGAAAAALVLGAELAGPTPGDGLIDNIGAADKPELTCISEEGIADMDLPDNLLDDLDYIGDCITSCNKVENYLMLSEFENNLIAEMPVILDRRGRRWSLARSRQTQGTTEEPCAIEEPKSNNTNNGKWRGGQSQPNSRVITVIDEASV